jgi:hypothetical protein
MSKHEQERDLDRASKRAEMEGFLASVPSDAQLIVVACTPNRFNQTTHFETRSTIACPYTELVVLTEVVRRHAYDLCREHHDEEVHEE